MGKKVKAKSKKAQQRDTLADAGSGDEVEASQDAANPTEEVAVADREHCGHCSRDAPYLNKLLREIITSKHLVSCEHCRDEGPRKKGGGKQQQKKKGGGGGPKGAAAKAKAEKSNMWVCLDCGRHFCGGEMPDTTMPYGHARRHAKQDRHWWAARYDQPTIVYCVLCQNQVPIEMPTVQTFVAAPAAVPDKKSIGAVGSSALVLANNHGTVIKGLPNLGNTCFFNSVLQSLLALDMFRSKMLGPDVAAGAITMSLKKLFVETSASNDAGGALSPKSLFSSISSKYPQFKGYQMQDSHELLRCFLDGLGTEETEARKLAGDASSAGVPTIVESIFGGQLSSTVSSTECTHGSVKHDQFLDLSLPVPSRKTPPKRVSSPLTKKTNQSIRDRNKNRRYAKPITRVFPTIVESNKEKVQTVAECTDSQIPVSELGQVVSEKEPDPSACTESCASVPNHELKTASPVEDAISWLDYLADGDETYSEILDSACSTEAGEIWESTDAIHGSLHRRDDALPKEQALSSEHSGEDIVDNAACLQPVILLPYKEVGTIAEGMEATEESSQNPNFIGPLPAVSPVAENYAHSLYGGDGDEDGCFGLGDMFGEPEVTSDANKETGTTGDIDVMAWSSNSADDEVDDSNAPISVEGCLALYTEPELLSESWHCEHCSIAIVDPNTNELKENEETAASDREESEEMMANGDEKQDDDKFTVSCRKKEDIDEITATDGCSNNVNADMCCNEGVCTNPPLIDAENTADGNSPNMENTTSLEKGEVFTINTTEQPDSKTNHQECRDLISSEVESTSTSEQPHDSAQHNDGHNVDVAAEETSVPVSCVDNDSASCSTTSYEKAESGANAEEGVTSSLPSETQSILPSDEDNEDGFTRNIGRRKKMKMVGKANKGKDNQNKQKEDKTKGIKMVGKANKGKENQNKQKEDKTKVFRAAMRRILISKAPPVLTITLNRFSHDSHGRFRKLKGHVCFKETLDIRPFMDPRSKENDSTTYRLVAVVEHMGTMTGGHYVAYVRSGKIGGRQQQSRASKSWFYASDSQVRETSLQEVLNCEAYILFYERVTEQDNMSGGLLMNQ